MAAKQSRRSVSMSRETYEAIRSAAIRDGMTMSEWVTKAIRAALPGLPRQVHRINPMTKNEVQSARTLNQQCANCHDAPATHHGRIDYTGTRYALCDECELPDDMRRSA